LAAGPELEALQKREIARRELVTPKADLAYERLTDLFAERAADSVRFGAKSANLGEVAAARIPDVTVPAGFSIPFSFHSRFLAATGIEAEIYDMLDDQRFNHD